MNITQNFAAGTLTTVLLTAIAGVAGAQQAPQQRAAAPHPAPTQQMVQAPQPAATETPQRTTATYDDWVVECVTLNGPPPQKNCDMVQVAQVQGSNQPFSRVGLGRPAKGEPVKLVVQVPVNVSFGTNVHIRTSDADPGLGAPFARCVPAGCFADFVIKDDAFAKLRAASGAGKLSFADANGHDIAVPLSFKGFAQAFNALAKQ